jgi:hypothetical protein
MTPSLIRRTKRPDGQITDMPVQPCLQKYSGFPKNQITLYSPPSRPTEGRLAIVANAGRDAVDAAGAFDERRVRRTAKSCGPDASTLASSLRKVPQATAAKKPDRRGERDISRKTIARGMPGVSRCDLTNACAFYHYHCTRGCGRIGRPAFPAPSDWRGRNEQAKPRAKPAAR